MLLIRQVILEIFPRHLFYLNNLIKILDLNLLLEIYVFDKLLTKERCEKYQ